MPVRYPISYRASRYIHTLVPTLVGTITQSLLPRGYSQFASCLRRDPNRGTERKRPYSPRSRALKVALLRTDRTDIQLATLVRSTNFDQPQDRMPKIVLFCLGRFPILSLCLRHQSQPIYHANARNLAQMLLLLADVTFINPPVVPVTSRLRSEAWREPR